MSNMSPTAVPTASHTDDRTAAVKAKQPPPTATAQRPPPLVIAKQRHQPPPTQIPQTPLSAVAHGRNQQSVTGGEMAAWKAETEQLFMRHSVAELRAIERKMRDQTEEKRKELRQMVGERYRDLIDAADSIIAMKKGSTQILSSLRSLHGLTDASTLKRHVEDSFASQHLSTNKTRNVNIFPAAAQIKLLVDIPEQKSFPVAHRQWDSISHFQPQIILRASGYLSEIDQTDEALSDTLCCFIVLGWKDPVAQTGGQLGCLRGLLQARLKACSGYLEDMANIQTSDALLRVVNIIRATLIHVAEVFLTDTHPTTFIDDVIRSIQSGEATGRRSPKAHSRTLLMHLFDSSKTNIHLIHRYLPENLQKFTHDLNLSAAEFESLTNDAVASEVRAWVDQVGVALQNKGKARLKQLINVRSLDSIKSKIWAFLQADEYSEDKHWQTTGIRLFMNPFSIWDHLLRDLFLHRTKELIHDGLIILYEDIICEVKSRLKMIQNYDPSDTDPTLRPELNVGTYLWSIPQKRRTKSNADIGPTSPVARSLQNTFALSNLQETLSYRATCTTPLVRELVAFFDNQLASILKDVGIVNLRVDGLDVDRYEVGKDVEAFHHRLSKDIFHFTSDGRALVEHFTSTFVEIMLKMKQDLERMVDETAVVHLKLFLGRFSRGLILQSRELQRHFCSTKHSGPLSALKSAFPKNSTAESPLLDTSEAQRRHWPLFKRLTQEFMQLYQHSNEDWIQEVVDQFIDQVQQGIHQHDYAWEIWSMVQRASAVLASKAPSSPLKSSSHSSGLLAGGLWEPTSIQVLNNQGEAATDTVFLPAHANPVLTRALSSLCHQIQSIGGYGLDSTFVLRPLAEQCLHRLFDLFESSDTVSVLVKSKEKFGDKLVLQLYFDFCLLWQIFRGVASTLDETKSVLPTTSTSNEKDSFQRFVRIRDTIQSHIDPIDFAMFRDPLSINVQKAISRANLFLCFLTQFHDGSSMGGGMKLGGVGSRERSSILSEHHHIVAMAPPAPRFTLLPVSQKSVSNDVQGR